MAISFNAAGLLNGNGIDVNSVVNAILNQQAGPLSIWQNEQTDLRKMMDLRFHVIPQLAAFAFARAL